MDNIRARYSQPGNSNTNPQKRPFYKRTDRPRYGDRNRSDRQRSDARCLPPKQDRPKKEAIVDLHKYFGQQVQVKFVGGRYVEGVLKGFDQLMNLVLEDVVETLRDPEDLSILTDQTRPLGKVIVRGPQMLTLSPLHGTENISNPFAAPEAT
ncbi:LSM-domain-containing protein [Metschnikowia bicuspidata]|uniref:LSM-domain-containing protein n=1 Tax=Metschnikowia bicuspidata TaxID=27322 RepID=A0A4P9Z8I4_9ASCO|nr:LSM-domain-containing protein [Metschnikowia bicuspidata]